MSASPAADFAGRPGVALVTGGSGGIGRAICRLLAERGADVVLTYRSNRGAAERAVADVQAAGRQGAALALELTDAAAVAEALSEVAGRGLHTLIHAAGPHVPQRHLSRVTPAQMCAALDAEAAAGFNLVSAALPALRESRGAIVAVTTAATRRFAVRDGLSAVPKAAVEMLIRAVAAEEGRFGVRANCVGPGMLTDGMAERLRASGDLDEAALRAAETNIALRRFGRAGDVAEAVAFLASPRAGYITGQLLSVDGGFGV